MNVVLLIIGTIFSSGLALMVWSLRHAPCGYQDISGFNFGPEPTPAVPQTTAVPEPSPAIGLTLASVSAKPAHDTKTIRFNGTSIPGQPETKALHHAA